MKKKIAFVSIYIVFVSLLFEFSMRCFYAFSFEKYNIIWRPFALMEHYYPGFLKVYDAEIEEGNEVFDVLLLGGSVLTPMWGNVQDSLHLLLSQQVNKPVEIYNVAYAAHTSRDSRLKYEMLKDKHFDAVVLYHGINEVRFNHCPKEMFQSEYNHVDFYAKVNKIIGQKWSEYTVLPLVFIQLKTNILTKYADDNYMPLHAPVKSKHKDWLDFGLDVKTAESFRNNYLEIIRLSIERDQKLIMPQFAFYIPDNYSLELFSQKKLDYGRHRNPVELWGSIETVSEGILSHNAICQEMAVKYQLSTFDANKEIDKTSSNFDDLCHFTPKGSASFALNVTNVLFEDKVLNLD